MLVFSLAATVTAYGVRSISLKRAAENEAVIVPPIQVPQEKLSTFCLKSEDAVTELCLAQVASANSDDPIFLKRVLMGYGTTTAFENTAQWKFSAVDGKVLGEGILQVDSPDTGVPGTFSFIMPVPDNGNILDTGFVTVYEFSAKDGTPIQIVKIPVQY